MLIIEFISTSSVLCEICFNPWQQVRNQRTSSQQQPIDSPLMIRVFTHSRRNADDKTELPWGWAWARAQQTDDWKLRLPEKIEENLLSIALHGSHSLGSPGEALVRTSRKHRFKNWCWVSSQPNQKSTKQCSFWHITQKVTQQWQQCNTEQSKNKQSWTWLRSVTGGQNA